MNRIIITDPSHRLHEKLLSLGAIEKSDLLNQNLSQKVIYDFTLSSSELKKGFFNKLKDKDILKIFSDFSCSSFFEHELQPHLFSSAFYSPNQTYESLSQETLEDPFFKQLEISFLHIKKAKDFFYFPRTIATIINEAYLALEDHVADIEDIDTAMKYGVNYPLGPFEWTQKIGIKPISLLLDELYYFYQDKRYIVSQNLR